MIKELSKFTSKEFPYVYRNEKRALSTNSRVMAWDTDGKGAPGEYKQGQWFPYPHIHNFESVLPGALIPDTLDPVELPEFDMKSELSKLKEISKRDGRDWRDPLRRLYKDDPWIDSYFTLNGRKFYKGYVIMVLKFVWPNPTISYSPFGEFLHIESRSRGAIIKPLREN